MAQIRFDCVSQNVMCWKFEPPLVWQYWRVRNSESLFGGFYQGEHSTCIPLKILLCWGARFGRDMHGGVREDEDSHLANQID